jgi:hypothetical protein
MALREVATAEIEKIVIAACWYEPRSVGHAVTRATPRAGREVLASADDERPLTHLATRVGAPTYERAGLLVCSAPPREGSRTPRSEAMQ